MRKTHDPEAAFSAASSPIYNVLDEEGRHIAHAQLRETKHGWVYVDEDSGWQFVSDKQAKRLLEYSHRELTVRPVA